jgi:hypothetical protein
LGRVRLRFLLAENKTLSAGSVDPFLAQFGLDVPQKAGLTGRDKLTLLRGVGIVRF